MERTEKISIEPVTLARDVLINWWAILLGAVAAALLTYVIVSVQYEPRYSTEATFVVSAKTNANAISNLDAANEMAKTFRSIIKSNTMNRIVCDSLGVNSVKANISAEILGETNLLTLRVSAKTSKTAVEVINAVINNYEKVSYYAMGNATMTMLQAPEVPIYPDNTKSATKEMTQAFIYAALAISFLFAFVSYLHDTIKQEQDVEAKLDARCLGVIAYERKYKTIRKYIERKKMALLVSNPIASILFVESYRKFATKVDYRMTKNEKKALVITSVSENEGKSTVASNLAISLAMQGKKVVLMDGDLRRPAQFLIFGQKTASDQEVGEYISGELEVENILLKSNIPNLSLVLGRNCYSSSTEMLQSERMKQLVELLKEQADYVLIDSPPVGLLGDAEILSQYAGAAIVVVRQNYMLAEDINEALDSIRENGTKLLGVVLNRAINLESAARLGRYERYSRGNE